MMRDPLLCLHEIEIFFESSSTAGKRVFTFSSHSRAGMSMSATNATTKMCPKVAAWPDVAQSHIKIRCFDRATLSLVSSHYAHLAADWFICSTPSRHTMSSSTRRPPSVSHRISLRFPPHPAEELTTTLVLNGGGTTHLYTDFRPLIDDPKTCEWAFAGKKTHLDDGRCTWSHVVDSRDAGDIADSGALPDIGTCHTLPNGDEMETGEMVNPTSGKVEPYEEVWREEEVPAGASVMVLTLQQSAKPSDDPRGIFMRVGKWAQGVVRGEHGVSACRWKFEGANWMQVASYGEDSHRLPAPTGSSLMDTMVDTPGTLRDGDERWNWVVVEDYAWHPEN